MLLLLHAGPVQECFLLGGGGVGWALINFLGFQSGRLFKGGQINTVNKGEFVY